jgi:hypothetical protein
VLPAFASAAPVEFNRDVRPILSDHCYQCHGPDKAKRKAGLRLDTEEGVRSMVVAGKPHESDLFRRTTAEDVKERMPPKSGRPLARQQIETLRRWIDEGAKWQKHWAFIPPQRPAVPGVRGQGSGVSNPIDLFIVSRALIAGLTPSHEADRLTLLRRVTLDLTGLPPTAEEVERARNDKQEDWYERAVDRLLASPRFGERMAIDWLDAARYADSNGYQSDGERFMWRWRDWVLEAINANMPFDRFTIEQLAGDMLPNPTLEQRIATGFNRNHRGNAEGGIVPEEYAVEYVVDRVDTTMAVWQGLTIGCARCHDHKYDPLSQKEYYQLFAYFNNVPEWGRAIKFGNSPPMIPAPTREQREQLREVEKQLAEAEDDFTHLKAAIAKDRLSFEAAMAKATRMDPRIDSTIASGLSRQITFEEEKDLVVHDGKSPDRAGRIGRGANLDGKSYLEAGDIGAFGFYDKFSLSAWIQSRGNSGVIVSRVNEALRGDGYMLRIDNGKLQFTLTKRWLDDAVRVESEQSVNTGRWHHVLATYDGTRLASGLKLHIDGVEVKTRVLLDELNQSFENTAPFRVGAGGGGEGRFDGMIDEVRIYSRCLNEIEAKVLSATESIARIAAIPPSKRTPGQEVKLREYHLRNLSGFFGDVHRKMVALRERRDSLIESFPSTMVMEEMRKPRDAFVLIRGQYDRRGDKVGPDVPQALVAKPQAATNRLDLARWLVSRDNPLTARVMVNRYWQHYFGTGLVKTAEDFGSQGEAPSHPELLDWLAVEFMDSGWDVKAMQRLLVTSATYRQSSKVTPEQMQKDPANRLLSRGPRLRLSAETIRDQALFASGLLVENVGGPSVKTYQPPGLWEEVSGVAYKPDREESLYRRSLYTYWKRTVTPPAMAAFDATAREACTVNRARTNTPLQALALLNDVPFVEASRTLAERVMLDAAAPEERLKLAFLRAVGRQPSARELQILQAGFERHRQHYRGNEEAARKVVRIGERKADPRLDVRELAAYTAITSLILNLDEVITRE